MNATVELIASTTKIASTLGVGTIVSGVIENAINVEELSAFRKTCIAAASITITGAVTMAADKYVDATAEKASKFIEDVKTNMKTLKEKKSEVEVETTVEKEEKKNAEVKKTSKKKNTTKKKKEEEELKEIDETFEKVKATIEEAEKDDPMKKEVEKLKKKADKRLEGI